ncbi:YHS domain-containing (seleno)protein [Kordiimonas aquimaris]|uniref:YHS domain-containing (seleno)protein n=1 Tax=Kordiimonas aquimaris TaxID=707591 RepID=UPI0021D317FE|nr:YHS domain-containing (seleno)protein [Kordiimonas aquimaris]
MLKLNILVKWQKVLACCALLMLTACGKSYITPDTTVNAPTGIGVMGYDVVAYHTQQKAIAGSANIRAEHNGTAYFFASDENLQSFRASPEQYLPAYGGYCAYAMSQGNVVDINPRNWAVEDGQLYLNANIFAQGLWSLDKQGHIKSANNKWTHLQESVLEQK